MSDRDLSKRYRDLAREEPPAALDAAILAASRSAVAKPSFSRRWGAPVSIAAVLVLAFGLTLEMEHDTPGVSTSVPGKPSPAQPAATTLESKIPRSAREAIGSARKDPGRSPGRAASSSRNRRGAGSGTTTATGARRAVQRRTGTCNARSISSRARSGSPHAREDWRCSSAGLGVRERRRTRAGTRAHRENFAAMAWTSKRTRHSRNSITATRAIAFPRRCGSA